jgi:hypothetical protein
MLVGRALANPNGALPHHHLLKTLDLTYIQPRPDLRPDPKISHFCQTDVAQPGTVPGSPAKSTSFYTTSASNPTANLGEGTVPFFAFSFPSLRAVMREAFAASFAAISAAHDGPAKGVGFGLFDHHFSQPRAARDDNRFSRWLQPLNQ